MSDRIHFKIDSMVNGCLEQGGICGRVESWPADLVMQIMEIDADDLDMVSPYDIVPHTDVMLREYLMYHHESQCHVVRRGETVE